MLQQYKYYNCIWQVVQQQQLFHNFRQCIHFHNRFSDCILIFLIQFCDFFWNYCLSLDRFTHNFLYVVVLRYLRSITGCHWHHIWGMVLHCNFVSYFLTGIWDGRCQRWISWHFRSHFQSESGNKYSRWTDTLIFPTTSSADLFWRHWTGQSTLKRWMALTYSWSRRMQRGSAVFCSMEFHRRALS